MRQEQSEYSNNSNLNNNNDYIHIYIYGHKWAIYHSDVNLSEGIPNNMSSK